MGYGDSKHNGTYTDTGQGSNDTIIGTEINDTLNGGGGNDTLKGLGGDDTIHAGGGNDYLFGGDGDDKLMAGGGDDVLHGGAGSNQLIGNGGWDVGLYDAEIENYSLEVVKKTLDISNGTDTDNLQHMEEVRFKNYTLFLDGRDNIAHSVDDTATIDEDSAIILDLLSNDWDFEGSSLTLSQIQTGGGAARGYVDAETGAVVTKDVAATIGTVTANADGTVTYDTNGQFERLAVGEAATDFFTYTITDGVTGDSEEATVTVRVTGVNDAPVVAAALSKKTNEDADGFTLDLLAGASDVDNGAVLHVANLQDADGVGGWTFDSETNQVTIDPNHFNYLTDMVVETLTLTYQVMDEHGAMVDQSLTLTVEGRIDPPEIDVTISAGSVANEIIIHVSGVATGPEVETMRLAFDGLATGTVYDANGNDVSSGVENYLGDNTYTLILPEGADADYDLSVALTSTDDTTGATASSFSVIEVAYDVETHFNDISFTAENQGMWASGAAPMVIWSEYVPIMGDAVISWNADGTGAYVPTIVSYTPMEFNDITLLSIGSSSTEQATTAQANGEQSTLESLQDQKADEEDKLSDKETELENEKQSLLDAALDLLGDAIDFLKSAIDTLKDSISLLGDQIADLLALVDINVDGHVEATADVEVLAGLAVNFTMDSGSVDAAINYTLTSTTAYNQTTDVLQFTPTLTNQTTGDSVAFETSSPAISATAVFIYHISADFLLDVAASATIAGVELFNEEFSTGFTVGTSEPGIFELIHVDSENGLTIFGADYVGGAINGVSAEIDVHDVVSTIPEGIFTIGVDLPYLSTEGTEAEYQDDFFDEGSATLQLVTWDDIMADLGSILESRPEFYDGTSLEGMNFAQIMAAVWARLGDDTEGEPIIVWDLTQGFQSSGLHINAIADDPDATNAETGTYGFYMADGETDNVVYVALDIDELVAWMINVAAGNTTGTILNPLDLEIGIDAFLEMANVPQTTIDTISKYVNFDFGLEILDVTTSSGISIQQEFALSVDDVQFMLTFTEVTNADGSNPTAVFSLNEDGTIVIDNASQFDGNGDGIIDYTMDAVPTAEFYNDTEVSLNLDTVINMLAASIEVGVSAGGFNFSLVDESIGPVFGIVAELDLVTADLFEDHFGFDLQLESDGDDSTEDDLLIYATNLNEYTHEDDSSLMLV